MRPEQREELCRALLEILGDRERVEILVEQIAADVRRFGRNAAEAARREVLAKLEAHHTGGPRLSSAEYEALWRRNIALMPGRRRRGRPAESDRVELLCRLAYRLPDLPKKSRGGAFQRVALLVLKAAGYMQKRRRQNDPDGLDFVHELVCKALLPKRPRAFH